MTGSNVEAGTDIPDVLKGRDWEALLVIVWIATRDMEKVEAAAADLWQTYGPSASRLTSVVTAIHLDGLEPAESELLADLANGNLRAMGFRNGQGDVEVIPYIYWKGASFSVEKTGLEARPQDYFDPAATRWTGLRFDPAHIVARWRRLKDQRPPLADELLAEWLTELPAGTASGSDAALKKLAELAHPTSRITKRQFADVRRGILGDRAPGPRKKEGS